MSDREHDDELESSVAAWVLGALEPEEAAAIGSHVEACPICRGVASRLRRVVGALPLAVEGVAPPARLRGGVPAAAAASRSRARAPAHARSVPPRAALAMVAALA